MKEYCVIIWNEFSGQSTITNPNQFQQSINREQTINDKLKEGWTLTNITSIVIYTYYHFTK